MTAHASIVETLYRITTRISVISRIVYHLWQITVAK